MKKAVVKYILENYNTNSLYKAWRTLWPPEFKHFKKQNKILNKKFRSLLFQNSGFRTSGVIRPDIQNSMQ